jgi:hypothetical protein
VDDQIILANAENFGTVTVCPGGVVHVHLPHCSLKFMPSDFERFYKLIAQASAKYEAPRPSGKPRLQVVQSTSEDDLPCTEKD